MTDRPTRKPPYHFSHPLLRARDWQDRPEFAQLCDWWRQIGKGVCALVGIGGAGKTAVVERFLRLLPQVLPPESGVRKLDSLPTPRRLFVFSFYDAPNPDAFFDQLAGWLTERMNRLQTLQPSYEQTVRLLEYAGPCLLVLDGLEKVQEDGLRGAPFGQIADTRLRSFVLRAAEGVLGEAAVLVTTRFALDDLRGRPGLNYREVPIERISEEACLALLRQRGVRGADHELAPIARACGFHALTVDLAGGYLAHFANGKAGTAARWSSGEPSPASVAPQASDRLREVAEQTARFERVARRYREALARTDPAALALLERVCLFRLGVDADLLMLVFTGPRKEDLSGPALAALSAAEVRARLERLAAMRLLKATEHGTHSRPEQQATVCAAPTVFSGVQGATYTVHPAVRDGFLKGLDPYRARQGHTAASEGLIASLGGLPGRDAHLSDPRMLDLLEEIVYHTLEAGRADTAWEMYRYQLGGYENLGRRLGAYERGERICRAFAVGPIGDAAPLRARLSDRNQAVFLNEWALYLSDLGRLDEAARCYARNIALRLEEGSWKNASIGNQNLADLLLAAGRLREALAAAEEAVRLAERASYAFERKDAYAYRGYAHALRGETEAALADFATALRWQRHEEGPSDRGLYRLRGVHHAWLLARLGRHEEAARLTEANKTILRHSFGEQHHYLPRCDLLLAGLARARGDLAGAREFERQAQEWAVARDARELLCWSAWERGCIALADARRKADGPHGPETVRCLLEARRAAEEGQRLARACGFSAFHIDLLLLRALIGLEEGEAATAECLARTALETGFVPPGERGPRSLLPAVDPECGYAWGEGLGRHLLAESLLLQAAQQFGRVEYSRARLPSACQGLLHEAEDQLALCRAVRARINDPTLADTERLLRNLAYGVLTGYPLHTRANAAKVR
jgi:tetratricopeptide (TPR) repeat protein